MSLPSPPLTAGSEENPLPECSQGKKSWQPQGHAQGCYKRPTRALGRAGRVWYIGGMKRPGLYANINARRKAGTSRPKSQSTISPRTWRLMKAKKGGFREKPKG